MRRDKAEKCVEKWERRKKGNIWLGRKWVGENKKKDVK